MGFFSFLKYTFIIFAAYLATFCGAFENHWSITCKNLTTVKWIFMQLNIGKFYYNVSIRSNFG
jgi:hypothetical protein